jgi:hypothetical protein
VQEEIGGVQLSAAQQAAAAAVKGSIARISRDCGFALGHLRRQPYACNRVYRAGLEGLEVHAQMARIGVTLHVSDEEQQRRRYVPRGWRRTLVLHACRLTCVRAHDGPEQVRGHGCVR